MPVIINSNHIIQDIEQHFKVFAGPGAGKTQFLVTHIKNILNNSKRLKIQGKIACITYTNIATETIQNRVGNHGGRLEISTIHSFLYANLIRPYIHTIAQEYNLDASKISGHDEIVLRGYQTIQEWKVKTNQQRLRDDKLIVKTWESLKWKFDPSNPGELIIRPPHPVTYFSNDGYLEYKKILWSKGLLHHDDVLFLSYELVRKKPFLLKVLRAKFPYFLVDEFQDTSPIQIALLNLIGTDETIIGIVGDEIQSIYSFSGAVPGQLSSFTLPNIVEYEIQGNWRSTNKIVELLNAIRTNLIQQPLRNIAGSNPTVIVGDKIAALNTISNRYPELDVFSLCRENIAANALQKGIGINIQDDLLDALRSSDSNSDRRRVISDAVKAIEYARLGYFKDALKTLGRSFGRNKTWENQRQTLEALKKLINNYDSFAHTNLINLVDFVRNNIKTIPALKKGAALDFYSSTPYTNTAIAVKNIYESGTCRTIHKFKGDEFDCVLVVLDGKKGKAYNENTALSFLLNPNLSLNEEHRVNYVGISRAQNHLFISTPTLSQTNEDSLKRLGFLIERIP